jgi:hypothetical protein
METKLCAYNLTRDSFLSMGLTTVNTATDPLTVLRVLVEGIELLSDSGFWLTALTGIPGVPRISPFDLAYLNEEKEVVQCIELLPGTEFPPFERHVVSALVLPLHAFSSTQTRTGDRLLICGEEELMHHLAHISQRSGDSHFRENGLAAEQYPARTAIPDPIPVPTQNAAMQEPPERKSRVPVDAEIPAQIASVVTAFPGPLGKGKSEDERAGGPREAPASAPEPLPNRTPSDGNANSKGFRRTPASQFPVPGAGVSMPRNIEFTVSQAPMWRVSSPVSSTSEANVRKLPTKESQPAHEANGLRTSKDKIVDPGKSVRPLGTASNGSAPTVSQPIAVQSAAVPADPAPSMVYTSVAKAETSWVREPQKPQIPAATDQTESVQDREHLIEKKWADEPIVGVLPMSRAQSKITTPKRPGAQRRRNAMTIQFPPWLQADFMKNSIQRFRQWFNAQPPTSDRRRSDRRQVPGLVAYYWTGGAPIEHKIADISETGFYLITEDRWIKETMLQMTLQRTPAKDGRPRQSLAVLTKVVRRGRDGVGHEFVMKESLDHDTREALPARGTDRLALGRFL